MKIKSILIACLLTNYLLANASLDPAFRKKTEVALTVVDEDGVAIEEVDYWIWYSNPFAPNKEGYEFTGKTNAEGKLTTKAISPFGVLIRLQKEGFYSYGTGVAEEYRSRPQPKEHEETIALRRILDPIPLHAKNNVVGRGEAYPIPVKDEWIGFDFEQGDWLEPHGEGKQADILFRYQNEFMGFLIKSYNSIEERRDAIRNKFERLGEPFNEEVFRRVAGKWDGILEIAFPGEKEGIIEVDEEFILQSELHLPHKAPEEGYLATRSYSVDHKNRVRPRKDMGFFLRTRVILDEDGEIKSANYAKIHGDFDFSPVGFIRFAYYYNPIPNDRNLEFDTKHNLFLEGTPGTFNISLS